MSFYTIFQNQEATLTASSSSTGGTGGSLVSTDSVLVYSNASAHPYQVPAGSVSAMATVQSVTTSTASPSAGYFGTLVPFGYAFVTSTTTIGVSFLPGAPAAGRYLTITLSGTCTTTGYLVIAQSTGVAIFSTGGTSSTVIPYQKIAFGQPGAYIDLISQSTGIWQVVGSSLSPSISLATATAT